MGDFELLDAQDVLVDIEGTPKRLQEAIDNGELGGGSGSGEENKIDSISVNGSPISIDENKNVDITVPDAYDDTEIRAELANKADTNHTHTKYFSTPDFSKAENISSLTSFTVPANGYLYIACREGYVQYKSNLYNIVEGVLNYSCSSTNTIYVTSVYPVTKDEILTRKNNGGGFLVRFVPCK